MGLHEQISQFAKQLARRCWRYKCAVPILFSLFFLLPNTAEASHFKGGQITYEQTGPNTYLVTVKSYWRSTWTSSVGFPSITHCDGTVALVPSSIDNDLLPVLPDGETKEFVQTATITVTSSGVCNIVTTTHCCRLSTGANFADNDYRLRGALNHPPTTCTDGDSPQFFDVPLFTFPDNQPLSLNLNVSSSDDMEFSLVNPYDVLNTYSGMTGFTVDATTGTFSWPTPIVGLWVVTVRIAEKCGGVLTGAFVERDFLVNIITSTNVPPTCDPIANMTVNAGQAINFAFTASDVDALNSLTLSAAGAPLGGTATFTQTGFGNPASGTFSWTPTSADVGVYPMQFAATDDDAFPLSCATNMIITVEDPDTIAPTLWCVDTISAVSDPSACGKMVNYSPPTAMDATPGDILTVKLISDSATTSPGAFFPVGITAVTWCVTDLQGNSDTCTFYIKVVDETPPMFWCITDIDVTLDEDSCEKPVYYTLSIMENCTITDTVLLSGRGSGGSFPCGIHTETWVVFDAAGNSDTCSFNINVHDVHAPKIACPSDSIIPTDAGACDVASFTYPIPAIDYMCDGDTIYQVGGIPNGGPYPKGDNIQQWLAVDKEGNVSDTCTFYIIVEDQEPPVITCPAPATMGTDPGMCSAVYTYSVTATDNCPGDSIYQIAGLASGSAFPKGTTTNTFVVVDCGGNTDTCSFDVTVDDTEPPVIACPADTVLGNDAGVCTANYTYALPTATDNCPDDSIYQIAGLASGSDFPKGTTVNTFVVVDCGGNTDTCSFSVTVNDTEPPSLSCPPSMTVPTDDSLCTAVVTYPLPSPTDNCPLPTAPCDEVILNLLTDNFPEETTWELTSATAGLIASGGPYTGLPATLITDTFCLADGDYTFTIFDAFGDGICCGFGLGYYLVSNDGSTLASGDAFGSSESTDFTISSVIDPVQIAGLPSGSAFPKGTTTNTFVITDCGGNTDTCSFDVTVYDNQIAEITCPNDTVLCNDLDSCSSVYTYAMPTTWDNCPGDSVWQVAGLPSGSSFPKGTTTNTFAVLDCSGDTAYCSFDVTVDDCQAPVIICPTSITYYNDPGKCDAVVYYSDPYFEDNCPGAFLTLLTPLYPSGATFPVGTTTVKWMVTDCGGNTAVDSFTVTVLDIEPPVIVGCPANITIPSDPGQCGCSPNYFPPMAMDNCYDSIFLASGLGPNGFFTVGTHEEVWVAIDLAGNTDTCRFNVIVEDVEDPVITCPGDITVGTDAGLCEAVVTYTMPSATDNCGITSVTQIAGLPSGSSFPKGSTVNTWVALDVNGRTDTCSFTVTVDDTEPPVVTCPGDVTISTDAGSCDAVYTFADPTVTDNCPGWTLTQIGGLASGSTYPKGTTTNTFVVIDCGGNTDTCSFNVTVEDNEAPVLTCPGDIIVSNDPDSCNAVVTYPDPTVSDNCPISTGTCSEFIVCILTDDFANETSWDLSLSGGGSVASGGPYPGMNNTLIKDTICLDPGSCYDFTIFDSFGDGLCCGFGIGYYVTTLSGDTVASGAEFGASETTSFCATGIKQIAGLPSGSTFPKGTTTNTFVAVDCGGNTDTCSFDVTVNDTQGPIIYCPSDMTVGTDAPSCDAVVTYAMPSVDDNCPGWTVVQIAGMASGSTFPKGTTTNTFVVTDCGGNVDTCSFDITVEDDDDPTITCPGDIVVGNDAGSCDAVVTYAAPTVTDNCPGWTVTQIAGLASGSTFPKGTTTNTFVVVDCGGNTDTCSFDVTVNDTEPPVLVCPAGVVHSNDPGQCGAMVMYPSPVHYDNCPGDSMIQIAGLPSGSIFPVGTTWNVFQVTDCGGNVTVDSFYVTVEDVEKPTIWGCPTSITVDNLPGLCYCDPVFAEPITTDNCPGATITRISPLGPGDDFPVGDNLVVYVATDASGNTDTCSFYVTVTYDHAFTVTEIVTEATSTTSGGAIDLTISGGIGPFTFQWSNGATTQNISGLAPGTYCVDIEDGNGCRFTYCYDVNQPACAAPTNLTSNVISPTKVKVSWDPAPGAVFYELCGRRAGKLNFQCLSTTNTQKTVSTLKPGKNWEWYVITHCADGSTDTSALQSFSTPLVKTADTESFEIEVFPNPATTTVMARINATADSEVQIHIVDMLGRVHAAQQMNLAAGTQVLEFNVSDYAAGLYTVEVFDGVEKQISKFVIAR